MSVARYIYWQDGDHLLGYFEDYPDYMTQGESLEDLFEDMTGGEIPGIRKCAELIVS